MTLTLGETTARLHSSSPARGGTKATAVRIHLEDGAVLSLKREKRGRRTLPLRVQCVSGRLWVTRQGDPDDHLLAAGEIFRASESGMLVVQAVGESSVGITDAP